MSHFTVLVTKTNEKDIERQLSPFDENREMPRHIGTTKAQFIEKGRKDVEHAKAKIAEYDTNPEAYEAGCNNYNHLQWLKGEARVTAEITDEEELFKLGARWYLEDNELDEDGNYWTTSNDDAKWDWYKTGGRWAGFFQVKAGATAERGEDGLMGAHNSKEGADVLKVKDIDWDAMDADTKKQRAEYYDEEIAKEVKDRSIWADNRDEVINMTRDQYINQPISHVTFAVLHDGKWYERGQMGWFACVSDEKPTEQWDAEFRKLLDSLDPETEITVVDCHI
jgi:hypothetical protein